MDENNNFLLQALSNVRQSANDTEIGHYYNENLLDRLENYNRADTVNMTNEEMNKFRHIAGTKQALNDYGYKGLAYALGKEGHDIFRDGFSDTKNDLKNDLRALKIHLQQPNLSDDALFNYVFQNYIAPYRKK